jgi:hypothetical protein
MSSSENTGSELARPNNGLKHLPGCGIAVVAGGALTLLINAGLSPFIEAGAPFSETAASSVFFWRQVLSALVAALLLIGSVGLHLRQAGRAGRYGMISFIMAFLGSAILLAQEWNQVFFVHELARRAPDMFWTMESAEGANLFDIGAMIALAMFTLGWIAFSISMLRAGVYSKRGPILVIAGFFAVPILAAALPDVLGMIIGNAVLGCGWILLGFELHKNQ